MSLDNSDVLVRIADAYVEFLTCLPWKHALVLAGAKEGLSKFLSNAYIRCFPARRKYELTQLISQAACDRLNAGVRKDLVFEHVVPKRRFIQEPCEQRAREGQLTAEFVLSILQKYWVLATVTTEEDRLLPRGWDERDILARYTAAGIHLLANPFAAPGIPSHVPSNGPKRGEG
jgi:hypothetical protein